MNNTNYLKQGVYTLRGVTQHAPLSVNWGIYIVIGYGGWYLTFATNNNANRIFSRIIYSPSGQGGDEVFGAWKEV